MDAFVSHTTALEVLRRWDLRGRLARGERCVARVPPRPPSGRELEELLAPGTLLGSLPRPIDVLVADGRGRTRSCDVRAHLQAEPLPEGSAVDLGEGLLCTSPEHLPVQMASRLTDLELTFLLSELLGTFDPSCKPWSEPSKTTPIQFLSTFITNPWTPVSNTTSSPYMT